ncbi:carbon starvation protein A [Acetomicrobium sp.]|jgi:carbon starvation protein|uniref:carbon starvation CstA family protein n=1 Tax=Acetomicrobium sp. TaxID=1872099 RepID=UPI001B59110A|nr:carbon starvation protein A [Acetomicrobium sp.]MBP8675089.1 carbon starvation protein A [Acetomicrobium sp.]MDR9770519.1 carbon starvation protein A [Acetomicrobium sp.]
MNTSLLLILGIIIYLVCYLWYGKNLERKVVKADDSKPTPAHTKFDDVDFVPTHPAVLFGHHFASIAGGAPILGPALAMAWGWWAGLLWIWFGNILIGAVHDYLSIMASVRYEGKSIQWIAGKMMRPRTSYLFQVFAYLTLVLALGAFSTSLAYLYVARPDVGSMSMWFIVAAVITGFLLYKLRINFLVGTIVGILLTLVAIWLGFKTPLALSYKGWLVIFFFYMMVASALPVWILLQPRDYLNAYILVLGLAMGVVALILVGAKMELAAFTSWSPNIVGGVPSPYWPVIPLIIACGSLSGIHGLIGSGTTSKQLDKETQGLIVGYGGMLTEGLLSTVVTITIAAFGLLVFKEAGGKLAEMGVIADNLKEPLYMGKNYVKAIDAVGGPLGIFTQSYGILFEQAFGISAQVGTVFSSLWVSAFTLTSMDTGNRVLRFAWEEVWEPLKASLGEFHKTITNRWLASAIPSALSIMLAWNKAYNVLWPAFGGANQMLAAATLLTVALWVLKMAGSLERHVKFIIACAGVLWLTVFAGLWWFLFAVPSSLLVRGFVILEIVLALVFIYDFYHSMQKASPLKEQYQEAARP